MALWAELLAQHPWVDDGVLRRAATSILLQETDRFLPNVGRALEYLREAKAALDREAVHSRLALPEPARNEAPSVDPNDPYSCTSEERERWAKEDAWIEAWAGRLKPTPPDVLERLSAADRHEWLDSDRRNASVAAWPRLTPAARRAKERRIAAERDQARATLAARHSADLVKIPASPSPLDTLAALGVSPPAPEAGAWPR